MKKGFIFFTYAVIAFAIYPILRYVYFVVFDPYTADSLFFVDVRVFLSGPLLFVSGILLLFVNQPRVKVIGGISIAVGFVWLALIFKALFEEAGIL